MVLWEKVLIVLQLDMINIESNKKDLGTYFVHPVCFIHIVGIWGGEQLLSAKSHNNVLYPLVNSSAMMWKCSAMFLPRNWGNRISLHGSNTWRMEFFEYNIYSLMNPIISIGII